MPTIALDKNNPKTVGNASSNTEAWLVAAQNRTPEEIAALRKIVFSKAPRSLPLGKSLDDVFVGALPDEKSEEEIIAALADLG